MKEFRQPIYINSKRAWVLSELDKLYAEWMEWSKAVAEIKDHLYNKNTQTEVFADGEENMKRHAMLQAKTLTFLNNNIGNHGFIEGFDGGACDRTDLRLVHRVKHRLHALDTLRAALVYAETKMPTVEKMPKANNGAIGKLSSGVRQYWKPVMKWLFGIVAVVLGAYLTKSIVG